MPVVRRNQVVLTFLTNLAGMIFEHLEEKLVHCASLAVWTQYRDGGRTQWPRASCKFGEKQMLRERSKSWPQSPPFQGYWILDTQIWGLTNCQTYSWILEDRLTPDHGHEGGVGVISLPRLLEFVSFLSLEFGAFVVESYIIYICNQTCVWTVKIGLFVHHS